MEITVFCDNLQLLPLLKCFGIYWDQLGQGRSCGQFTILSPKISVQNFNVKLESSLGHLRVSLTAYYSISLLIATVCPFMKPTNYLPI